MRSGFLLIGFYLIVSVAAADCGGAASYFSVHPAQGVSPPGTYVVFAEACENFAASSQGVLYSTDNLLYTSDRPFHARLTIYAPTGRALNSMDVLLPTGVAAGLQVLFPVELSGSGYYAGGEIYAIRGSQKIQATAVTAQLNYLASAPTPTPLLPTTPPATLSPIPAGVLFCNPGQFRAEGNVAKICRSDGTGYDILRACPPGELAAIWPDGSVTCSAPVSTITTSGGAARRQPGFEAVFAVAGLLLVSYLVSHPGRRHG